MNTPTLEGYLRLAAALGITLEDLLNERSGSQGNSLAPPDSPWGHRRSHVWADIEPLVLTFSTDPSCPSLKSVADVVGTNPQELRKRFRPLTDIIVARFGAHRTEARLARLAAIDKAVEDAVHELVALGEEPARRNLEALLGPYQVREAAVRDAWIRVSAEAKTKDTRTP